MPEKYEEEEVQRPGRVIGYSNKGPLYSRIAPYRHRAVSSAGELGDRMIPGEKVRKRKTKEA